MRRNEAVADVLPVHDHAQPVAAGGRRDFHQVSRPVCLRHVECTSVRTSGSGNGGTEVRTPRRHQLDLRPHGGVAVRIHQRGGPRQRPVCAAAQVVVLRVDLGGERRGGVGEPDGRGPRCVAGGRGLEDVVEDGAPRAADRDRDILEEPEPLEGRLVEPVTSCWPCVVLAVMEVTYELMSTAVPPELSKLNVETTPVTLAMVETPSGRQAVMTRASATAMTALLNVPATLIFRYRLMFPG